MFDTARDDQELAGFENFVGGLSKLDTESARLDQEQFVGVLVVVPDEVALGLRQFDRLSVEFPGESRRPRLLEGVERIRECDFLHNCDSGLRRETVSLSARPIADRDKAFIVCRRDPNVNVRLPRVLVGRSSTANWSLGAGVYAVCCSVALLFTTGPLAELVADFLFVPGIPAVSLTAPVAVAVPVLWWSLVERPDTPSYVRGAAVGAISAALTIGFWGVVTVVFWSVEMVTAASILFWFLLSVAVPAGAVGGLPLILFRRRSESD